MKFLHTGDLHLGKTICEYSVQEDQQYILSLLLKELRKDTYTALIIAGDIYDRSIPPAEAVELFSRFLTDLQDNQPELSVLIIAGNHDSAKRIGYADQILKRQRIYIGSDPGKSAEPIVLEQNGEEAAVYLLPFMTAGSIRGEEEEGELPLSGPFKGQREMAAEAVRRIEATRNPAYPAILVAHVFTLPDTRELSGEEERVLGTAGLIEPDLFRPFSYTALGHIHRPMRVTDRVWYSGSPLACSFDEADVPKCFLKVTVDALTPGFPVSVEQIPITPLRAMRRLSDSFSSFYNGTAWDAYRGDFLELEFTDTDIVENPMALLRSKFPYLLNIRQQRALETLTGSEENAGRARSASASIEDDFSAFLTELYGSADAEKLELFTALAEQENTDETAHTDAP